MGILDIFQNKNKNNIRPGQLLLHHEVDNVELRETCAVHTKKGNSFGSPMGYLYREKTETEYRNTSIAAGSLILNGDRCFFEGEGQVRTIITGNINQVQYFTDVPGIKVSTLDNPSIMTFILHGRTIDDGGRLCDAVRLGRTEVLLTRPTRQFKRR